MGKKKKPKGTWSDRRRWLMGSLSTLIIMMLGKTWDFFQSSPRPMNYTYQGRGGLKLGGTAKTHFVSVSDTLTLSESVMVKISPPS